MISKQTAMDIALAYREIEHATREMPDIRDAFGRHHGGLQLGVPSGHSAHRLFDVPWSLAKPVIEAHIAHHKAKVAALTEKARAELETAA